MEGYGGQKFPEIVTCRRQKREEGGGRGGGEPSAKMEARKLLPIENKGFSTVLNLRLGSTIRFGHESAASNP